MYLEKVNLLFELGRYADAETELRAALTENPDDALAHAMLGVALSRLGKTKESLAESETAIQLDPTSAYHFFARSLVLIRAMRYSGALEAVRTAIQLDSTTDADYFMILSSLLYDKRQWSSALEAADRGLAIDPRHVGSLNRRGHALLRLNRPDEAQQAFAAALAAGPDCAATHHAQGVLLLNRADGAAALDHLLEARRLDPVANNDTDSIALAAGRRMWPFRWLGVVIPRWYLWPPKICWACMTSLLFLYIALHIALPLGRRDYFSPGPNGQWYVALFGMVLLNLMLAPFTLDVWATSAVYLGGWRLVGTARRATVARLLHVLFYGVLHLVATALGMVYPFVASALAVAACRETRNYYFQCRREKTQLGARFILYLVPLVFIAYSISVRITHYPRRCLPWAVVFACLSFFSDNVPRWVQRRA
jgi:tetratricopeptide (TPR) repeat protein